ncbi:flagellar hook-length control protein FliK [Actimicrobium sp. CCI2.3]|uniref:flagellar hook-length control protein FliK n=1 Tax=Actimicrobium sp. CCI2.3 TaxID=3048616 RepID=UPI002AB547C5|nr:flagellar hook-length control protein FliK [Actimicrobium sp. CCI2.3]MDY7575005.1 flagellar hook-length control protein FliK [Actimicrobium sp. CCI2.3]MEB0021424.1 flagellar hook-length control protein FliK [Actimicrobium sp. CCI2.3]
MQNNSIVNTLAPVVSASAGKPRAPENNAPDQQFNQMLSRQMNERLVPKATTKPADPPKPVSAKAPDASGNAATNEPASKTSTTTESATDPAASKPAETSTKEKPDSSATALPANSTDAVLNASAAIMALVANAGVPAAATPSTPVKADLAPDVLTKNSRIDLRALPDDGPTEAAIKELVAKDAGKFTNALQTASTANLDKDTVLAKLIEQPVAGNGLQPALQAAQQTALTMAAPAGVHPGNSLTPQIDNSAWNQALGQRMVWMVAGAEQSATLTLNPPDLGPLQVVLNVSNGQADASFFANQPEVRQALEAALPKLREMLGDAGISLGQANVSSGSPNPENHSGQRDNGARRTSESGTSGTTTVTARRITSAGNGMVDTFA